MDHGFYGDWYLHTSTGFKEFLEDSQRCFPDRGINVDCLFNKDTELIIGENNGQIVMSYPNSFSVCFDFDTEVTESFTIGLPLNSTFTLDGAYKIKARGSKLDNPNRKFNSIYSYDYNNSGVSDLSQREDEVLTVFSTWKTVVESVPKITNSIRTYRRFLPPSSPIRTEASDNPRDPKSSSGSSSGSRTTPPSASDSPSSSVGTKTLLKEFISELKGYFGEQKKMNDQLKEFITKTNENFDQLFDKIQQLVPTTSKRKTVDARDGGSPQTKRIRSDY